MMSKSKFNLNRFFCFKFVGLKILVFLGMLLGFLSHLSAELFCVRKKQVKGDFSKNFKVVSGSTCPSGFKKVIDTASFQGPAGPQGTRGPSGVINIVESNHLTSYSLSSLAGGSINSSIAYKAADFPQFTKTLPNSTIRYTFMSHMTVWNDSTNGGFCSVQLRINDATSNGSTGNSFTSNVSGVQTVGGSFVGGSFPANQNELSSIKVVGYFKNLPAGTHTPSVWLRGTSVSDCTLNEGNFRNYVIIEEIVTE